MRYRGYRDHVDPIWIIIAVNAVIFVVAFILDIVSPMEANPVVYLLGLQPVNVANHPWTILTSMFTHIEIWHILINMLTFYFFGGFLIELVGERRFLLIYFGGGILGSIFYILITLLGESLSVRILGSPYTIAIGASGAVYALGGTLVMLKPQQKVLLYFFIPIPLWLAVIGGFLLTWQGTAWQAHLGGLIFGAIAGYFFRRSARYIF